MKLADVTPLLVRDAWVARAQGLPARPCIAAVAAAAVDCLYEQFAESLVMVRAFLTVPYQVLPERQRAFAAGLARSVQLSDLLRPHTPVHSLLATRGKDPEWNRAHESRGHVAIPLLSEAFVSSIPMMSRLLKELGLPLSWVQDPGTAMERQTIGSEVGVFFVADPERATDEIGRLIIPAQEFVSGHAVRSVFAVGGVVFGGAVFVLILFSREPIALLTARAFMPLVSLVKSTLVSRCSMARVFPPESSGDPDSVGGTE
jgi:hypothetical protein